MGNHNWYTRSLKCGITNHSKKAGHFWEEVCERKKKEDYEEEEYIYFFIYQSFHMFHWWRLIWRAVLYFPTLLSFRSPVSNCNRNSDFIVATLKSSFLSLFYSSFDFVPWQVSNRWRTGRRFETALQGLDSASCKTSRLLSSIFSLFIFMMEK